MPYRNLYLALCAGALCSTGWAADGNYEPARTRPEMKKQIEALKNREARIPLPALTSEETASGRRSVNNGRLRSLYLPESWQTNRSATPTTQSPGSGTYSAGSISRAKPWKTGMRP